MDRIDWIIASSAGVFGLGVGAARGRKEDRTVAGAVVGGTGTFLGALIGLALFSPKKVQASEAPVAPSPPSPLPKPKPEPEGEFVRSVWTEDGRLVKLASPVKMRYIFTAGEPDEPLECIDQLDVMASPPVSACREELRRVGVV